MKEVERKTVEITEVREIETVTKTSCDWCKKEIVPIDFHGETRFVFQFSISTYTRDGSGEKKEWYIEDLCLSCIENLKTLLQDSGIQITEDGYDW